MRVVTAWSVWLEADECPDAYYVHEGKLSSYATVHIFILTNSMLSIGQTGVDAHETRRCFARGGEPYLSTD